MSEWVSQWVRLQAAVYDILPSLEEGAGKRCSEWVSECVQWDAAALIKCSVSQWVSECVQWDAAALIKCSVSQWISECVQWDAAALIKCSVSQWISECVQWDAAVCASVCGCMLRWSQRFREGTMRLLFSCCSFLALKRCTSGEFMYLLFTRMPGESYRRRLRFLSLYLGNVFRALINSLVCCGGDFTVMLWSVSFNPSAFLFSLTVSLSVCLSLSCQVTAESIKQREATSAQHTYVSIV